MHGHLELPCLFDLLTRERENGVNLTLDVDCHPFIMHILIMDYI